jgi:hypothetical protein
LRPGEQILGCFRATVSASGGAARSETRKLLLTTLRLVHCRDGRFAQQMDEVPYKRVESVDHHSALLGHRTILHVPGATITVAGLTREMALFLDLVVAGCKADVLFEIPLASAAPGSPEGGVVPPATAAMPATQRVRLPGLDLDTIDPLDFEEVVRQLVEKMGYRARRTKASRDGGVDIEAYNAQPIVGGKIVVQCKCFSSVVGASYIRDLAGVVGHVGATKGVLVTTSRFSPDAYTFALGKPLELIDRGQLEALLHQYGVGSGPGGAASARADTRAPARPAATVLAVMPPPSVVPALRFTPPPRVERLLRPAEAVVGTFKPPYIRATRKSSTDCNRLVVTTERLLYYKHTSQQKAPLYEIPYSAVAESRRHKGVWRNEVELMVFGQVLHIGFGGLRADRDGDLTHAAVEAWRTGRVLVAGGPPSQARRRALRGWPWLAVPVVPLGVAISAALLRPGAMPVPGRLLLVALAPLILAGIVVAAAWRLRSCASLLARLPRTRSAALCLGLATLVCALYLLLPAHVPSQGVPRKPRGAPRVPQALPAPPPRPAVLIRRASSGSVRTSPALPTPGVHVTVRPLRSLGGYGE